MALYDKALNTVMHSRFVSLSETKGRDLTDSETIERATELLENLPFMGYDDKDFLRTARRQLKALIKKGE